MNRIAACVVIAAVAVSIAAAAGVFASSSPPGSEGDPLVSRSYVDQLARFRVVVVPEGQSLVAMTDGVEIIVRAGRAIAIGSDAGGLADTTVGRDIGDGITVSNNHHLIVPRSDGRGVLASIDLVLMVRGGYTIR